VERTQNQGFEKNDEGIVKKWGYSFLAIA